MGKLNRISLGAVLFFSVTFSGCLKEVKLKQVAGEWKVAGYTLKIEEREERSISTQSTTCTLDPMSFEEETYTAEGETRSYNGSVETVVNYTADNNSRNEETLTAAMTITIDIKDDGAYTATGRYTSPTGGGFFGGSQIKVISANGLWHLADGDKQNSVLIFENFPAFWASYLSVDDVYVSSAGTVSFDVTRSGKELELTMNTNNTTRTESVTEVEPGCMVNVVERSIETYELSMNLGQ